MKRLQSKAAKNKPDAEDSEPSLRKVVGVVLDEWIYRHSDTGDQASHQPYPKRERPDVIDMTHESAANQRGDNVSDSPDDSSPKLATREARTARGYIIDGRAHAARIGE